MRGLRERERERERVRKEISISCNHSAELRILRFILFSPPLGPRFLIHSVVPPISVCGGSRIWENLTHEPVLRRIPRCKFSDRLKSNFNRVNAIISRQINCLLNHIPSEPNLNRRASSSSSFAPRAPRPSRTKRSWINRLTGARGRQYPERALEARSPVTRSHKIPHCPSCRRSASSFSP